MTVAWLWGMEASASGARRNAPEESYNPGKVRTTCRPLRQHLFKGIYTPGIVVVDDDLQR